MLEYTNEPLFVRPTPFSGEKVAAVTLNRDGEEWEEQIIKALHEEHPYIAERDVQIHITKEDAENGVGVGSIHLDGKLAIPLIIDKFKLAPLDIVWDEGKLQPLTRTSLERRLLRTATGKPIAPGSGEATDVSLYSRAQPPFDGKYTYASFAGPGSIDTLTQALESLSSEDCALLCENPIMRPVLLAYGEKTAQEKTATVAESFGLEPLADNSGFHKIASAGPCDVVTPSGLVPAIIFDHVFSVDGSLMPKLGFVATIDQSARGAMLAPDTEVFGRPLSTVTKDHTVGSEPQTGETGVFFKLADGRAICSRPITLLFKVADGFSAVSDGKRFRLNKTAAMRVPMFVDNTLAIPADWTWLRAGEPLKLCKEGSATVPTDRLVKVARNGSVYRATIGATSCCASEHTVREFISERLGESAAKTALAALATMPTATFKVVTPKAVRATRTAKVTPVNLMKHATYVQPMKAFEFPLGNGEDIKVAAVTDDGAKKTVDALLGLNFLNPETIHRFVDQTDAIDEARETLAKLLLASRLGLDVDSRPLRTAMFALDSVSRDLKELRNAAEVEEQEN